MLLVIGIVLGNTLLKSGIEVFLMGICSGLLLLLAAKQQRYPFAKEQKVESRAAFAIWILFFYGILILSGPYLMAIFFGNGWLKLLAVMYLIIGKPLANMYPDPWNLKK